MDDCITASFRSTRVAPLPIAAGRIAQAGAELRSEPSKLDPPPRLVKRLCTMAARFLAVAFIAVFFVAAPTNAAEPPDWTFNLSKVSKAELSFSPDQWKAIKPAEPAAPAGGGFQFDLGAMLAPAFLRELDTDKDGAISHAEFASGFARWMAHWDIKQQGFLDVEALRDGVNKDLRPDPPRSPAGSPPPPGGNGGGAFSLTAPAGRRNGLSGMMGINFKFVHGDLNLDGQTLSDVGVRYKGNGTYLDARQSEKKSFKVVLNEYVKGQKLSGLSRLNFHSNVADPSWMNEALSHELYRAAGVPSMHTAFTRLYLTVPGAFNHDYLGLYSICEDPDVHWAEENFLTKKGLILKPSTRELFIDKGADWSAYAQAYDAKTDITQQQILRVHALAQLITSATDDDLARKLPNFLDIDEFSRFMAVTVWLSSTDSILMLGQNFVVYLHPKSQKFSFVPWDVDRTFGNFFFPQPELLSIRHAWTEDNRFLDTRHECARRSRCLPRAIRRIPEDHFPAGKAPAPDR